MTTETKEERKLRFARIRDENRKAGRHPIIINLSTQNRKGKHT